MGWPKVEAAAERDGRRETGRSGAGSWEWKPHAPMPQRTEVTGRVWLLKDRRGAGLAPVPKVRCSNTLVGGRGNSTNNSTRSGTLVGTESERECEEQTRGVRRLGNALCTC